MQSNGTTERMTRSTDRPFRAARADRKRSTAAKQRTKERAAIRRNKRGF